MVDQLAFVYAVATHPANMAPRAEMTHSGELKLRMATAWWGSRPNQKEGEQRTRERGFKR